MPTDIEQFLRLLFGLWVTANNNSEIKDLRRMREYDKSESGYYINYEKLIEKLHNPKKDEAEELITVQITDSRSLQLSLSLEKDNKSYLVIKLDKNIYLAITVCQELGNNVLKIIGKDFSNNQEREGLKTEYLIRLIEELGGSLNLKVISMGNKVQRIRTQLLKKLKQEYFSKNNLDKRNHYYNFTFKLKNNLTNDKDIDENINYYKSELGDTQSEQINYQSSPNNDDYIIRPYLESKCYNAINQGDYIRIRGTRSLGKTRLLDHLIQYAQDKNHLTIRLDFREFDSEVFTNLKTFYEAFCNGIIERIKNDNQQYYLDFYNEAFGVNKNTTRYFEQILLQNNENQSKLVLAMDNVDRLFPSPFAVDVGNLWRSWYDNGQGTIRQKMIMIITHSTLDYPTHNMYGSPFEGIGKIAEINDFQPEQIQQICRQYDDFTLTEEEITLINNLIGTGTNSEVPIAVHPYMIQIAIRYLSENREKNVQDLIQLASSQDDRNPFNRYLSQILQSLQNFSDLRDIYSGILTDYHNQKLLNLSEKDRFQLDAMGLIKNENNQVLPKYEIYKKYFTNRLLEVIPNNE